MSDARENLKALITRSGDSYASISRMLGRNSAYVQQFITRGTPAQLEPRDRGMIADHYGVDEAELGGPLEARTVEIRRLAVQASAGAGLVADDEFVVGAYRIDAGWLKSISDATPEHLSIITVRGDSMTPTLASGDDVLVDRTPARRLRDGIYVLRRDDTLMVKRITLAPTSATLAISSDNPAYPTWHDCPIDSAAIIGRVVWTGRKFG